MSKEKRWKTFRKLRELLQPLQKYKGVTQNIAQYYIYYFLLHLKDT